MHKITKKTGIVLVSLGLLALLFAAPLAAQELPAQQQQPEQEADFSDEEIESFASALVAIEEIQTGMQEDFNVIIEDSGMDSERFYELHSHYTQTQGELPEDVSSSESDRFQGVFEELVEAEQSTQEEMITAVENEGLDVETFNAIVAVAQQNPELWEEIQSYQ
ncbi:MAG: DUF4168 domain-containing protein [Spirochaeta sp.]